MSSSTQFNPPLDRRQALRRIALGAAGLVGACKLGTGPEVVEGNGRLTARPGTQTGFPPPGASPLLLDPLRDGQLYVPPGLTDGTPAPLIVTLHGAGGSGQSMLNALQPFADQFGLILLCPDSRGSTWDAIRGRYADDVRFIDSALTQAFDRCNIDPQRIGIAGFSDGASYALGLGRLNGDLFRRIVAFSPGLLLPAVDTYKPPVYITHGYGDGVLPIEVTSVVIVDELEARGYDVTFRPFDGGHWIPAAYAPEAFHWLITGELDAPS